MGFFAIIRPTMLPSKFRAKKVDIEQTIKSGINVYGSFLYAKVSRFDVEHAGFAAVVSKKVEKTSVGRHLLKRRINASIESYLPRIEPSNKKVIVFFVKKIQKIPKYSEIKKEVEEILNKIIK